MTTTRSIPFDQLRTILEHKFRFRHIKNAKSAKGFFVKLERCPLPIYNDNVEYTGSEVMEMLGKLDDWEKTISECREGLYDFLEREIRKQQGQPLAADNVARPHADRGGDRQPHSNENRKPEFHPRGQQPRRHPPRSTPNRGDRDGNR